VAIDTDLLTRARLAPQSLSMDDAVSLARQLGFVEVRQRGSHRIFHHPFGGRLRSSFPRPLNLQQGSGGKAKAYQVKQLLQMAMELGIIP
jgi:hypothetical protein